ncbi:organic cation transporter protein-like [Parasteatoda tepidariorum]|uniref:organic cation transporter protein-like n=1 Tax=Parasteatoda tepidariorum TaxID=114398 RepID=UPI001C7200E0|nr:organic cation transporter protein-like [Parasteatoda tepidariorum]
MTADIEKQPPSDDEIQPARKLDIFDVVGGNGLWQKFIFLVVIFYAIPSCTHNLSMSFLAPNLEHWCARPDGINWTVEEWTSVGLPEDDKRCSRYKEINFTHPYDENGTIQRSEEIVSCDAWEYDTSFYTNTVLNQWDLVCDQEWLVSMSKSVFMAGNILSNFAFGHISDQLGRRPAITTCAFIAFTSAIIQAFSTSFIMFIVTRFFLALGISGVYNISFVLLMEVIGAEHRSFYGIAINFGWCVGFVSLPGFAFVLKDWFWIQIALTAPCVILLGTWWLLPESPRWLMFKGRTEEAHKTLMKAAKRNGKNPADIDSKIRKLISKATEAKESGESNGNFIDLFKNPSLCKMTLNIYFLWFVNSIIYYGLSYNTNELAGNPFVNFAVSGAVEFPAYFCTMFVITSLGRRNPVAGAMIIGGIACLLMYPLPTEPTWLITVVSMVGKFCITCSFATIYVYTSELFPTVVRNLGLGTASMFSRFGSLIAPFARELGNATHPVVPQIIFGVLAFIAGLLVLLLPETNNCAVPDTVAEAAARRKKPKTAKIQNGNHVTVTLSTEEDVSDIQEDGPTIIQPSPKLQENGKKLDVLPEEEGHDAEPSAVPDITDNEDVPSSAAVTESNVDENVVAVDDTNVSENENEKTNL